jgi:tetratricopeptide (TPR) repeat protein
MAKKIAAATGPGKGKGPAEERGPRMEERFAAFSARYYRYFAVPIVAAIVVVIVLAIGSSQRVKRRRDSLAAFQRASTIAEFDAVARDYPRSFVGKRALAKAGDLLYEQGNYAEARRRYEAYLESTPDPALAVPVWTAVVQTYIAEEDYAGGIKTCEQILGSESLGARGRQMAERQVFYYTGYCYERSDDLSKAREWYNKLVTGEQPGGAWGLLARQRLDALPAEPEVPANDEGKNPEKDVDRAGSG